MLLDDVGVGGVEHVDAAAVELEDQAFFGVQADAVVSPGLAHANAVRLDHGHAS